VVAIALQSPPGAPRTRVWTGDPARRGATSFEVRRRRRHVAAAAVAGVASVVWTLGGAAGWLGSGPLAAPEPHGVRLIPVVEVFHVVQPGDTVWSIARSFQTHGEIRPLVDRLEAQTHGQALQVGDRIALP
jgi:hypothetical protein